MNLRESSLLSTMATLLLFSSIGSSRAEVQPDYQNMLDSVVFIECDVEFQGDLFHAASGSGFLIANSEYVITNNHVIDQCHSDNKITVLREQLLKEFVVAVESNEEFQAGVKRSLVQSLEADFRKNPQLRLELQGNPELIQKYVLTKIDELINTQTRAGLPNVGQKLFIVYLGKEGQSPIQVDVSNIVWTSSKGDERARETGMDIAILKLTRPLADRPSVTFATGSSARVSDTVYAVGFPGASGEVSGKYIPTFKKGIVSKLGGESPYVTEAAKGKGWKGVAVIETDAAISAGNSGGPLYNQYGEVLGINSFVSTKASGIGWAQDIAVVVPVLKDLGLQLPRITDKPRTWLDDNLMLVGAVAGIAGLALISGLFFWRRNQQAQSSGAGIKRHRDRSAQPVSPAPVGQNPVVRGLSGEYAGASIPVSPGGLLLGRTSGGEGRLMFSDNSDISRRHCTITYSASTHRFEVTDLGSSNGTFLLPGEKRLAPDKKAMCASGQVIRLGRKNEFKLVLQ